MATIVIIGGHGKIALLAEPLLTAAGHQVEAVIRNPDQAADVEAAGATPIVASVESTTTQELTELFRGADVIVWSAGAGGGDAARTTAVDRDAAIRAIDAAALAGVPGFVLVSYFGAGEDHGVPSDHSFFAYAEAKAAADAHLRASALDWTIIAPSTLTLDEPSGLIEIDLPEGSVPSGQVSRGNVAAVIAEVVDGSFPGVTIRFNDGETPIPNALQQLKP